MKLKRLLILLLLIMPLFTVFSCSQNKNTDPRNYDFKKPDNIQNPLEIWNGEIDESWYSYSENQFEISTAQQLAGFSSLVNHGFSFENKKVVLTSDIYLNDLTFFDDWGSIVPSNKWVPIGTFHPNKNPHSFYGFFDGSGKSIYGMYIDDLSLNASEEYNNVSAGLFGSVRISSPTTKPSIKNFNLCSSLINVNREARFANYIGTIAGHIIGGGTYGRINGLLNVFSNCNIDCSTYAYYVGGLTGFTGCNIFNSAYVGKMKLSTEANQVGGISSGGMIPCYVVNSYSTFDASSTLHNKVSKSGAITYQSYLLSCYYQKNSVVNKINYAFGSARRLEINDNYLSYGNGTFADKDSEVIISDLSVKEFGNSFVCGDNRKEVNYSSFESLTAALNSQKFTSDFKNKFKPGDICSWAVKEGENNGFPVLIYD